MELKLNISQRAQDVVENYVGQAGNDAYHRLVVSMYALRPCAGPRVLASLAKYDTGLGDILSEDEVGILMNEYKDVVRHCSVAGKGIFSMGGFDAISPNILDLCSRIVAPSPGCDILVANSGIGQFLVLNGNRDYHGYEGSQEKWALSQILLEAFGVNAHILNRPFEDALDVFGKRYDSIFTFLPGNYDRRVFPKELTALAGDFLKEGGQMCCVLPKNVALGQCAAGFREMIVGFPYAFEVGVIWLPDEVSGGTFVLCLKKNRTGNVTLVDATMDMLFGQPGDDVASGSLSWVDGVIESMKGNDPRHIWRGMVPDLRDDHRLMPSLHLMEQFLPVPRDGEKLMEIGELVELVECEKRVVSNDDDECLAIGLDNLSTRYLNCIIQQDATRPRGEGSVRILSGDALLFGYAGGRTLVSRFHRDGEKAIGLSDGIISFTLTARGVISEDYLLRALTLEESCMQAQEYAQAQEHARNRMAMLSVEDFLRLRIVVPSKEEQDEVCRNEARKFLTEADRKLLEEHEDFRRDMHMKKHAIGQPIHDFKNWWDVLQKARKDGNGNLKDDAMVGRSRPIPVAKVYDNLDIAMSKLVRQIYCMDRGNGMVPEDIALTEFIEDYIKRHQSPLFHYEYDPKSHHHSRSIPEIIWEGDIPRLTGKNDVEKGDPIEYANFPREALEIIFDNIIGNACAHGFAGRDNENDENEIMIKLTRSGKNYVITIANNGEPITPQLSAKDVFTYGKTTQAGKDHFGIGGYEVYRLMREFKGEAECILTPDEEFTVTYKLTFRDTNIYCLAE